MEKEQTTKKKNTHNKLKAETKRQLQLGVAIWKKKKKGGGYNFRG